jgi:hypothetical protein
MGYAFDDGPNCTQNTASSITISWAGTRKVEMLYIGSSVLDLPLEAQRDLADGRAREWFSLLFHQTCRVTDTWPHCYSELLWCAVATIVLRLAPSDVAVFFQ